jgi:hypothetical protein
MVGEGGGSVVAAGTTSAATAAIVIITTASIRHGTRAGDCASVFFVDAAVHALDNLWFECKALLFVKLLGLVKLRNHLADNAFNALLVLWWNVIFARGQN